MPDWKYIDWAAHAAIENLKEHHSNAEFLTKEANTLLTVLLAGIGAALSYGMRVFDQATQTPMAWGAFACALWLAWVGGVLMLRCIMTRPIMPVHNEPKNIYKPTLDLSEEKIKGFELDLVQARIEAAKQRNTEVAWWLDRCRLATIATPVVFIGAAWVSWN